MDPKREEIIKQAAIAGGNAIQASTLEIVHTKGKDPHNIVTKADLASEKAIMDIISKNFPKDHILSEEGSDSPRRGDRLPASPNRGELDRGGEESEIEKLSKSKHLWVIDPLDGTNNFKHGRNFSCVSIAYIEDGVTQLAAVYNFYTQELYSAQKGKGSYLNNKSIEVSKEAKLSHAIVATDVAPDEENYKKNIDSLMSLKPLPWITMLGSGVLAQCFLASGKVDLFVHSNMFPWDRAAAFLIIEEAGGINRDWNGKPTNYMKSGSISGNKTLVEAFVKHLKLNTQDVKLNTEK